MYYFLSERIAQHPSGIEHAQIKRLRLFEENHVQAKIFTNAYDRFFHYNASQNGLNDTEILNLFDWLQHTETYHGKKFMVTNVERPGNCDQIIHDGENINYIINKQIILKVIPFSFDSNQVSEVHYLDFSGHIVQKDFYDTRGFLSFSQFMDQNGGGVVTEIMYTVNHQPAVEISYRHQGNQYPVTLYRVLNYAGNDWYFDNMNQLIRFVLDELNLIHPKQPNTLLADLDYVYDRPMTWLTTKMRKFLVWHNIHTTDPTDLNSAIYANYEFELKNAASFDGLIVPTKKQAADIKSRFNPIFPIITLPFGYVNSKQNKAPKINSFDRITHKIIAIARIHEQKNLPDMIAAFNLIQQAIPDATLDIWGYSNDQKLFKFLQNQINDLHLTKKIALKGYTRNLNAVYDTAQLMLLTSRYEGYGLAVVEALSHGVPVISYQINYGPEEIIKSKFDGSIVPQGDYQEMAKVAISYLKNPDLLIQMSQNAYKIRQTYSTDQVWQEWKNSLVIQ
ncbi:glycosyltransferase [Pediococcus ethanolidurans]|uniref:Glycosyltransferase n=1 Tax=Pediococcus ethanolidurans TaxID=319653 RepID=A0A0R2K6P4_9LACO|nr:glycosyltransferase [Pediococcus ethanolidurans]KRN82135.1 glycosyltransferase [Pediococcus ethanolidurans]GEN95492.1 poly(glycerol-phosphate) alpha-glucosyltransferase [Pediococcus ethanolidurans]SER72417.1 poly(glycerol-phosphate) alpha-glucosyltransferase [Pediococcus ethanolidurans]